VSADVVAELVRRYGPQTDGGDTVGVAAEWFLKALGESREHGGLAAVEIGVRNGGMSAIFCGLAGDPNFLVLSVDPYGSMPMLSPGSRATYGEENYGAARKVLGEFPNSVLFRMPSEDFLARVLPWFRWWRGGVEFPLSRRFIAFAWVDGQHDDVSVVGDVAGLYPFMAPNGVIAIDNTEDCPAALAMIRSSPKLAFLGEAKWQGEIASPYAYLSRSAFTVPP
jgi:hypothetical protein